MTKQPSAERRRFRTTAETKLGGISKSAGNRQVGAGPRFIVPNAGDREHPASSAQADPAMNDELLGALRHERDERRGETLHTTTYKAGRLKKPAKETCISESETRTYSFCTFCGIFPGFCTNCGNFVQS
jgi:hypothetical protein